MGCVPKTQENIFIKWYFIYKNKALQKESDSQINASLKLTENNQNTDDILCMVYWDSNLAPQWKTSHVSVTGHSTVPLGWHNVLIYHSL